jgi:hypothetical protein
MFAKKKWDPDRLKVAVTAIREMHVYPTGSELERAFL